jgi:nucleotide-binding universal stress UspA family protein
MNLPTAVQDFHRARRKAAMEELVARLTGKSPDLLSYEEVRKKLRANTKKEKGLRDIPMDAIVGSAGRYTDFTRSFLPKQNSDAHRWARVKVAASSMEGLPPIEVYQVGDVYFVRDGNHRVSVARDLGASHIQAYVTEVQTDVPMTPDVRPDDLILKAEYADFLKWSNLRKVLPGIDLILTEPGKYADLKEHISVHRYYMGLEKEGPVSLSDAVRHWYETVYRPVVDTVHRLDLLRDFPERTETDIYLWMAEHRAAIESMVGWEVEPDAVAEDLAAEYSSKPERILARVSERIVNSLTPESLSLSEPAPGAWRERRTSRFGHDPAHLFHNILVTLDGQESGWQALDEALKLARQEQGRVLGLHIVPTDAHKENPGVLQLETTFKARCADAKVPGEIAVSSGTVAHEISLRARWADLVVAPLNYPPGSDPIAKLRSGFRTMIVRSPCPVLAIPKPIFPMTSALLAYDGSPKSQEALFVAAYMATCCPELSLVVLTTHPDQAFVKRVQEKARAYLSGYNLDTVYIGMDKSEVGETITSVADTHDSSLIIMGGYGYSPMVEVMLGSSVNEVLRISRRPVLICR